MDLNEEELEATRKMQVVGGRTQGKTIELAMQLREEILKLSESKMYGVMNYNNKSGVLIKEEVIPVKIIKQSIEKHKEYLQNQAVTSNPTLDAHYRDLEKYAIQVLQELLEGEIKC